MEEDYGYDSSDDECYDRVYDDDDDDGFQEPDEEEGEISLAYRKPSSCKVIRKESLLAAQKDDLQRVMDLLSLKEHNARTLLVHYRWDVDMVIMVYVEKGVERLFTEAGMPMVDSNIQISSEVLSNTLCQICYDEFPSNETTTMDCGHCFCNGCWTEHFITKINEGKSRRITCMAHKCFTICDEGKIRSLVGARDPQLAEKFDRFLLESYIEDNKRVKWCPSVPHCGNAIRSEKDECCEVECACGRQFCFGCSSETHSPCSCLMWKSWCRKCQDESETVNWLTAHAKLCPRCHKPVEKNGGCNLVRCICGQPFCWLCGGATGLSHTWHTISNHECGRYKEKHGDEIERAKKALWRYSHYFNRYKGHLDSLRLEESLKEKLREKTETLESRVLTNKDYSWVAKGLHRLTRSRQILLYSYPFAYYMFGDELLKNGMTPKENTIKQNLFEDQQQQLEVNIERLSMFLEEPFADYSEAKIFEVRENVLILSGVTDNLCGKLYECIDNDLLDPLVNPTHVIAPYRSKGVEKASELLET